MTPTELARKSGLASTTLTRFLNGRGVKHSLSARTLGKLAAASDHPVPGALVPVAPLPPQVDPRNIALALGRRIRAARMAYQEDATVAADALGITLEALTEVESGVRMPEDAWLARFAGITKCGLAWLFLGVVTNSMSRRTAMRIALVDPDLAAASVDLE